jgi:hypothetical protein
LQSVKNVVFEGLSATTLGGLYNNCSFGKTKLTSATSAVAPVVQMPCTGTTSWGGSFTTTTCDFDDFAGWAEYAVNAVSAAYPSANYFYKVIVIPGGTPCGWAGLGYVGCDGSFDCTSWIDGSYIGTPQVIMHEQGHNMYLHHAATNDTGSPVEYGDWSCSMGYCCQNRCFNSE